MLFCIFSIFSIVKLHAQSNNVVGKSQYVPIDKKTFEDSIKVSLLTCEPGALIYELYGHTAIRIKNIHTGEDLAFNYGMFNFHTPNFVMRFLRGETDYMLGVYSFEDFCEEYSTRGSLVIEQELNIYSSEKKRLVSELLKNALPENRIYRYNFLYKNCTSQARDAIEACINGSIEYPVDKTNETYREIIHVYTKNNPWAEFGQDLLLGATADEQISQRQKMFAPWYFEKYVTNAIIVSPLGYKRPLVNGMSIFEPQNKNRETSNIPFSPNRVLCTVLIITVALCFAEFYIKRVFWGFELLLMTIQGLVGCIITFLFFFSEHPTVNSNWLIIVFNPIPLVYIVFRIYKCIKHKYDIYAPIAFAVEILFLVSSFVIPQYFSLAIYCFILSLCLQSGICTFLQYKLKWKKIV